MPSKTEKQRKFIFYKRGKYKTKKNTPKSWKWLNSILNQSNKKNFFFS